MSDSSGNVAERIPQLTLALLLIVAASVLVGGAALARRQETIRTIPDRTPLRHFAGVLDEQTRRLERLYENHLRQIGSTLDFRNFPGARPAAERIVGIRQISLLRAEGNREVDQHLAIIKPPHGRPWVEPTLRERPFGLPRLQVILPAIELLGDSAEHAGWIDRPGEPLFFWQRRDLENVVIVFLLDRDEIAGVIDDWFKAWIACGASGTFAGVGGAGGLDHVLGAKGRLLAAAGAASARRDQPDFLLPVQARFGTWLLASWDQREVRQIHHLPTLVGACALALFIGAIASVVFVQQRRASALALQRVSFVNRVSHELRTPLTNILLNLDLASEALSETSHETARRLALIREEGFRLGRLIDNVLTFSRREQGKLRTEPRACVPASVIRTVLEQFAPSFARRGLELRCSGELAVPVLIDPDPFAQILANLFSNLEKYVPGGVVALAGTLENDTLTVTVADNGPGIPAEARDRVFRPFERLDSRVNEGATGTGLGLAIARELAKTMGGSLGLLPSSAGASFELRVPARRAEPPAVLDDRYRPQESA